MSNDVSVHFHPTTASGVELGSLLPMAVWVPGTNLEHLSVSLGALPQDQRPPRFCTYLVLVEESRDSILSALGRTRNLVNDSRQRHDVLSDLAVKSESLLRATASYLDHAARQQQQQHEHLHPSQLEWADGFERPIQIGVKGSRCAISVVSSRSTRRLTIPRIMAMLGVALHNFMVFRMALLFHGHASPGAAQGLDGPWMSQMGTLLEDQVSGTSDLTRPPLFEDETLSYGLPRAACLLPILTIQCWRLAVFIRVWMVESDRHSSLYLSKDGAIDLLEGTALLASESQAAAWIHHRDSMDRRMFAKDDWALAAWMLELLGDVHCAFAFGCNPPKLRVLFGNRRGVAESESELEAHAELRNSVSASAWEPGATRTNSNGQSQPVLGKALLTSRLLRLVVAARLLTEASTPCLSDLSVQAAAFAQDVKHLAQLGWFSVALGCTWRDRGHIELVNALTNADNKLLSLELVAAVRDLITLPPETKNSKRELKDLPRQHRHANLASDVSVAKMHAVIRRRHRRETKLADVLRDSDGLPASSSPRLLGEEGYDSSLTSMLKQTSVLEWQNLAELLPSMCCRVNPVLMTWWKDLASDLLLQRSGSIAGWADRKDAESNSKTAIQCLESSVELVGRTSLRALDDPSLDALRACLLSPDPRSRYEIARNKDVGRVLAMRWADAAVLSPVSVVSNVLGVGGKKESKSKSSAGKPLGGAAKR
jgi:hypothetical protein